MRTGSRSEQNWPRERRKDPQCCQQLTVSPSRTTRRSGTDPSSGSATDGQILRLEDENQKTRLLKQAVMGMVKPYPAGPTLMDVPDHDSMEQVIEWAQDVDRGGTFN